VLDPRENLKIFTITFSCRKKKSIKEKEVLKKIPRKDMLPLSCHFVPMFWLFVCQILKTIAEQQSTILDKFNSNYFLTLYKELNFSDDISEIKRINSPKGEIIRNTRSSGLNSKFRGGKFLKTHKR
jgi:hypothetical protein